MASWLGARWIELERCGSTNDEALALAKDGAAHGTIVTAREQTRGRGRAGRAWHSPAGANLYLSILLRPTIAPEHLPGITLATGIGVCDATRAAGVANARLKWPNDVLVGARKLAGVLTEMTTRGSALDAVVVGIGVDVDGRREDLPPELAAIATSIRDETGAPQDVRAFAGLLLDVLEPWLDRFLAGGVRAIAAEWQARADLDRRVRVGTREGTPLGLADDGGLRVLADDGEELHVLAGDVLEIPSS
jgi:BirA family transcriptional regulator, biotin operon repressor / biotin---[acetyl-CoA-carboxylase] ligase